MVVGAKIADQWPLVREFLKFFRPRDSQSHRERSRKDEWMEREGQKHLLRLGGETDSSDR